MCYMTCRCHVCCQPGLPFLAAAYGPALHSAAFPAACPLPVPGPSMASMRWIRVLTSMELLFSVLLFSCSSVYRFPRALVTNNHKPGGLKHQTRVLSQFWRPAWDQGVRRASFPLKVLGENPCLFWTWWPQPFLGLWQHPSNLHSVFSWPSPLCLCVSVLSLIGFRAHLNLSPHLSHTSKKTLFLNRTHSEVPGGYEFGEDTIQPTPSGKVHIQRGKLKIEQQLPRPDKRPPSGDNCPLGGNPNISAPVTTQALAVSGHC